MPPPLSKREAARQVVDVLLEISTILNTHLDHYQLSLCVSLIENGVNPEALADVIRGLRGVGEDGRLGQDEMREEGEEQGRWQTG